MEFFAERCRKLTRFVIVVERDRFFDGIDNHLAGVAVSEMCLEFFTNSGINVAIDIIVQ